jgi:peroxiredoxin
VTLSIGERAPSFRLRGIDNAYWILGEPDERKSVLVVFFRRESGTCRLLLPFVERLHRRAHPRASEILGISLDNQRDTLEFSEDYCFTFPIVIESSGLETVQDYRVESVPTLIRLDEELIAREVLVGWSRLGFENLAASYLEAVGAEVRTIWESGDHFPDEADAMPIAEVSGRGPRV